MLPYRMLFSWLKNWYITSIAIYIVADEEDHRGGTGSWESDVTDTAFGRKGRSIVRQFGTNSLKEGAV
jgi:hypothetical protein